MFRLMYTQILYGAREMRVCVCVNHEIGSYPGKCCATQILTQTFVEQTKIKVIPSSARAHTYTRLLAMKRILYMLTYSITHILIYVGIHIT